MDNKTIARKIVLYTTAMQASLFFSSFFENGKVVDIALIALSIILTSFLFLILTINIIFDVRWDENFKFSNVIASLAIIVVILVKNAPRAFG